MVCFCFDVHFARNSPFGVGLKYFAYVFFFTKQSQKKVDPHFADRFGQSGRPNELIQTQMTQKPMLRAEVYARALRASQNRKEDSVFGVHEGIIGSHISVLISYIKL